MNILNSLFFWLLCILLSLGNLGNLTIPPFKEYIVDSLHNTPIEKIELWNSGITLLRGINIYQRRVYPELDGNELLGNGPVGPPFTEEDFLRLSQLGANYVHISHPGIFTETPPYQVDKDVLQNLDHLIQMIATADMFVVIAFRTGPGRSEFTFFWDEVGEWFGESYLNDRIWSDPAAQDAWVEMWRYTAERYRDNPYVIGYDLMVEPNSNEVGEGYQNPFNIWNPEEFYRKYNGSTFDWNTLYPRIVKAIREVDPKTPILIGGLGYSSVEWLPYLKPLPDKRLVYCFHQYEPISYTHQDPNGSQISYSSRWDINEDGIEESFDRRWLEHMLQKAIDFSIEWDVSIAVTEFGVMRWVPGASEFLEDEISIFERMGVNYAIWVWDPSWEPWSVIDSFNYRHDTDPNNHRDIENSSLLSVIREYWEHNTIRPSNIYFIRRIGRG